MKDLSEIDADDEASAELYNAELKDLQAADKASWFTAPWLYAE